MLSAKDNIVELKTKRDMFEKYGSVHALPIEATYHDSEGVYRGVVFKTLTEDGNRYSVPIDDKMCCFIVGGSSFYLQSIYWGALD